MSDQDNFGKTAKALARGPLGIIALFIALVYAMAGLVFILAKDVNPGERTPLIYFLVIFPCFVLGVFAWLVAKHHEKLYAPGDFVDEVNFLNSMRAGFVDFKSDTAYRNLDVMYMELLKIGLDNPRFISRDLTSNYMSHFEGEELLRYGHFAFMTWNICESIYDQRDEINISKTWNPILRVENRLHRRWFECEQNRIGFKQEFQEFVLHELTREAL